MSPAARRSLLYSFLPVAAVLVLLVAAVSLVPAARPLVAQAQSGSTPLTGWAWSETVGWVSLDCTGGTTSDGKACGATNYGLTLNTDGTISGYAWSENIGWIQFGGLSGFPAVSAKVPFSSNTTWVVPAGVTSVTVKSWGAGGAGGAGSCAGCSAGGAGGGGGFAQGTITVTPGETLTIKAGGGGAPGFTAVNTGGAGGTNGGGVGGGTPAPVSAAAGGGGGGYSGVFRSATALVVAGAGGGGAGADDAGGSNGAPAGAGGGTTGVAGSNYSGVITGGGGGTPSAGGAAGSGVTAGGTPATAGSSLAGGAGGNNSTASGGRAGGGGGGAGYFGGGGGGAASGANIGSDGGSSGGGGGSSYVVAGATGVSILSGSGAAAANTGDSDYASSAGAGGVGGAIQANGAAGTGGRVVVSYGDPTSPSVNAQVSGSNAVIGWAKATGNIPGWDGWIALSGSNFGVALAPCTSYTCNYARGDAPMGWLSFNFGSTLALPTVESLAASNITSIGVTFNGRAIPNGTATTGFFRYSTTNPGTCNNTFGTRIPSSGGTSLGSGSSFVTFLQNVSLAQNTTYYYCALAKNTIGTAWGSVQTFTTPVDVCLDISGDQAAVPPPPCMTPVPSPGSCVPSGYAWSGAACYLLPPTIGSSGFYASPARVRGGAATTLYYTVSYGGSLSCTITGDNGFTPVTFTPTSGVQGSVPTNAITGKENFTLSCTNGAGTTQAQAVVVILPAYQEI